MPQEASGSGILRDQGRKHSKVGQQLEQIGKERDPLP